MQGRMGASVYKQKKKSFTKQIKYPPLFKGENTVNNKKNSTYLGRTIFRIY